MVFFVDSAISTKAPKSAGSIQLSESNNDLKLILQLDSSVEITDKVYWELFLDVRPQNARVNLYEKGIFQLLVKPAMGSVETGIGPAHPKVLVAAAEQGRRMEIAIPFKELSNDYHFDHEVMMLLAITKKKIVEIPIPTRYAEESTSPSISATIKYSKDVISDLIKLVLHKHGIIKQKKFLIN